MAEGFDADGFDAQRCRLGAAQFRNLEMESDSANDITERNISASDFENACSLKDRFEKLQIFNAPMCLIYTDDQGKLAVKEDVLSQTRQIDLPLNIITICGLYRTGKSYLMNRLAGKRSGFSLGRTTKSHTKGIWAWCRVHPTQPDQILLLLDTEGLADIEKGDNNHDDQLFSLSILLSSTVIYNMIGVFNKEALEKLTFITQLSQEVQVFSNGNDNMTNHNMIRAISPFFILCLRDFYLDIDCENPDQPPTPDEYFQNCLVQDRESGCETYNETRECITNFFPNRKCFTIAQPALGKKLKNLDATEDTELEQEFVCNVDELRDFIYQQKHKMLDAVTKIPVNGVVFDEITSKYVEMLRKGLRLTYQDAYQQVAYHHNNNLLENLLEDFSLTIYAFKFPFACKTDLHKKYCFHQNEVLQQFRRKAYLCSNIEFEKQAMDKMNTMWARIQTYNSTEVQSVCAAALQIYHKEMIEPQSDQYKGTDGYEIYVREMENLKELYLKQMKEYDTDELSMAWTEFKRTNDYENMQIYREATKQLDNSRYVEFKRNVEEKLKTEFQQQMQEMLIQRDINFQQQIQNMEDKLAAVLQDDMNRERTYEAQVAQLETLRSRQLTESTLKAKKNVLLKENPSCIVM